MFSRFSSALFLVRRHCTANSRLYTKQKQNSSWTSRLPSFPLPIDGLCTRSLFLGSWNSPTAISSVQGCSNLLRDRIVSQFNSLQKRHASTDDTEGGKTGEANDLQIEGQPAMEVEEVVEEMVEEKPKRIRKKEMYGTYEQGIEQEIEDFPEGESVTHLYDTRTMVEEWMGHKTLMGMLSEDSLLQEGEVEIGQPPKEEEDGPVLRWETRMILGPGGNAWHPANRKVKVSVTVSELELSNFAKERLLVMVGKRYHSGRDELTLSSERFKDREENRKDVLRTLIELIKEAKRADELIAEDFAT